MSGGLCGIVCFCTTISAFTRGYHKQRALGLNAKEREKGRVFIRFPLHLREASHSWNSRIFVEFVS